MKIGLGIRFYEENPEKVLYLERFITKLSQKVDFILVVINNEEDRTNATSAIRTLKLPKTTVFGMNVWGKYTPALNAIVYNTVLQGCTHLFLISPEIECDLGVLEKLISYMDENTLVAGAALAGHHFSEGQTAGSGVTMPWNTFALWNLQYLVRTGFVLAGDAPFAPSSAGVEEVSTCSVLQGLYPHLKVKLVKTGGVKWHIGDLEPKRISAHIKKIETKKQRAQKQLEFLGLPAPKVEHWS